MITVENKTHIRIQFEVAYFFEHIVTYIKLQFTSNLNSKVCY